MQTYLAGIGIVQSHVTASTLKRPCNCKVERNGLGMAQMQIAVGLRGKSGANWPRPDPLPLSLDLFLGKGRCRRGCYRGLGLVGGFLFVSWGRRSNLEQTLRFDARTILNDFGDEVGRVGESVRRQGEIAGGHDNHCHRRQEGQCLSGDEHDVDGAADVVK